MERTRHSICTKYFPGRKEKLFFLAGILMLLSEIWKQLTLTFLLGHGQYNWWYFPFQLCSIPMYVLLAYPWFCSRKVRDALHCFLMCYALLGGIAVFADTSGLHYSLGALTVHSYVWHFLLIGLGVAAGISSLRESSCRKPCLRSFLHSTGLYLACCIAAECFNLSFGRFGTINMFYINPDYQMQQIVFHELSLAIGNPLAIFLYICSTVLGAFLIFCLWRCLARLPLFMGLGGDL